MMVVLKSDYSHCPLKKRPLSLCYDDTAGGEQTEPEDLSLKCGREAPPSLLSPRTYFTRTQESFVHERRTPVIRTREPRQQTTCSQEPHSNTLGAHDPDMHKVRPQEQQTRTTLTQVSDTLGICIQERHTHVQHTQVPHGEDRLPEPKAESSAPELRISSCSPATPTQHFDTHLGQVPGSRCVTTYTSDNCGSSGSPCTDTNTSEHLLSTPGSGSTMPLAVASPSVHTACSEPRLREVGGPGARLEQASSVAAESPSVHTEANSSRLPEVTSPGVVHGQHPTPAAAARPHRPWLADDPPRQLLRQFQNNVTLQPARPRPFLANSQSLWAGVVPLSWPIPHLLAASHPPSPGRHYRECGSPGSESASSDGSSGGGRGEARYSCTECSKSYSTYSGLSKHKQLHCAALGAKSFGCKHCDKVYTSLGALKMHIRTHTLPCKCQLCGKAFSRPWLLQGHIRTHTGEKPFQCPQCDRCFADRSNLRAHLQTHADVKKYACATCHKTFSRMSLLNKHTEAACPSFHRRTQP